MRRDVDNEACPICGNIPYDSDRRVLVEGRVRRSYCSQACLRVGVRTAQRARRQTLRRRYTALVAFVLAVAGVGWVRHRLRSFHLSRPPVTTSAPVAAPAPAEEPPFGPSWPPTDEEWLAEFTHAAWIHPLPGPGRRRATASARLLVVAAPVQKGATPPPPRCRSAGHCGVELDGDLWGEHVFAAHDGVIDRLQRAEEAPGGVSVRIAHWGGAVFTQYSHLAAIPTHLAVGTPVEAGEVIGLAGGAGDAREELHFSLSVRPSSELPEIYWDPLPLMATWPLQTPARGSVAGLVAPAAPAERVAGTPLLRRHPATTVRRATDARREP